MFSSVRKAMSPRLQKIPLPNRSTITPRCREASITRLQPLSAAHGACCGSHSTLPAHANGFQRAMRDLTSGFGLVEWLEELQHKPRGLLVVIIGMYLFHQQQALSKLGQSLVLLFSGLPLFKTAFLKLTYLRVDASVLMSLSALGSIYLRFPGEGLMLLVLFQIAHLLEDKFTNQSKASLESMLHNIPHEATLVDIDPESLQPRMETVKTAGVGDIPIGSHILIKPGEQVPLDGEVQTGKASLTIEHISGEVLPIQVKVGSKVPAGSHNLDGLLVLKTLTTMEDSTPMKIAHLAMHAQEHKPRVHSWIDQITTVWSRSVLLVASLVVVCSVWIGGVPFLGARGALYRALCIITVAAPCALVVSPLAYICALAHASQRNILIKSTSIFDALKNCQSIVLDKTGTLTEGKLTCIEILNEEDIAGITKKAKASLVETPKKQRALSHAVDLARRSTHPISAAIVDAGKQYLSKDGNCPVSSFSQIPGSGVQGVITPHSSPPVLATLGSFEFIRIKLNDLESSNGEIEKVLEAMKSSNGKSVSILTTHEQDGSNLEMSAFYFRDQLQNLSCTAVKALQEGSWKNEKPSKQRTKAVSILTGDSTSNAQIVGELLGIEDIYAEVTPKAKLEFIQGLQAESKQGVVMVGDGLNDAPALAQADVGIAISETATGLSAGSSDIVLLNGKGVANLPFLFHLSDRVRDVVQQNLVIAFGAMLGVCIPALSGLIPLWLTVLFHEGSTILIAMNSCRLLVSRPKASHAV